MTPDRSHKRPLYPLLPEHSLYFPTFWELSGRFPEFRLRYLGNQLGRVLRTRISADTGRESLLWPRALRRVGCDHIELSQGLGCSLCTQRRLSSSLSFVTEESWSRRSACLQMHQGWLEGEYQHLSPALAPPHPEPTTSQALIRGKAAQHRSMCLTHSERPATKRHADILSLHRREMVES